MFGVEGGGVGCCGIGLGDYYGECAGFGKAHPGVEEGFLVGGELGLDVLDVFEVAGALL